MMHGQGVYKWGDGRMFIGEYHNDRKNGNGIYLWADGRAYNGEWGNGKQSGDGFYIVLDTSNSDNNLKIKKGNWKDGKRQTWKEELTDDELKEQQMMYQNIVNRKLTINHDIIKIENTMQQLVLQ